MRKKEPCALSRGTLTTRVTGVGCRGTRDREESPTDTETRARVRGLHNPYALALSHALSARQARAGAARPRVRATSEWASGPAVGVRGVMAISLGRSTSGVPRQRGGRRTRRTYGQPTGLFTVFRVLVLFVRIGRGRRRRRAWRRRAAAAKGLAAAARARAAAATEHVYRR